MRRLLRLALPLGLLTALLAPTSAGAQTVTDSGGTGGLTLLASSPTGLTTTSLTGDLTAGSTTVGNLSVDARSVKVGSVITGNGIPSGSVDIAAGPAISASIAASPGGATESGTTVTITTTAAHGLAAGASINIVGVGVAGYNGNFTILTTPTATTFTYTAAAGLAASGGGTVSSLPAGASEVGTTATITTTANHTLAVGSTVTIAGVGVNGYNGTFTVTGVPTPSSFTYTAGSSNLVASGGGTAATSTVVTSVGLLAGVSVDPLGTNNTLAWAARLPGAAGNGITVAYNDPGGGAATLGASVAGNAVTINLGRGEVGATGSGIIAQSSSSTVAAITGNNAAISASPNGATESGNTVTITTTAAHGLAVGDTVNLTGIGVAGYNGNFTVSTVVNTTRFTVLNATTGLAASGGGNAAKLVSGASSNGSTATITTTAAHGLSVGQTVTVSGVGVADYNGTFVVTAIPTLSSFTYSLATTAIAAAAGSLTETGNTVTVTTATPHGLAAGQTVSIAGAGVTAYNGIYTVASAPTGTTFTVTNATSGLLNSGGGTVSRASVAASGGGTVVAKGATQSGSTVTIGTTAAHNLQVGQTVTIAGVGVGGYNGDFTVASIPTTSTFTVNNGAPALADSGGGTAAGHSIVGTGSVNILGAGINASSIVGATEVGTTATITTSTALTGLAVGQRVTIAGLGVAGYNGTFAVTAVNPGGAPANSFTYVAPVSGLGFSSGGSAAVFGLTETANTVTVSMAATHNLGVGQTVTIAGALDAGYNGTFTIVSVPTATQITVTNPTAGLAPSGGGTVGFNGLSETGTTAWVTTRAAHNLQVGQVVTLQNAGAYNGDFIVGTVPTANTFTYTTGAGLTPSGGGSTFTVTSTAQNVIDAVTLGAGQFAAVNDLVSVVPSGTVTGRLSPNASNPPPAGPAVLINGTFTGGVDQALGLSQAATATSAGTALQASFSRRNTDLAFWGNTIVQGDERGIRTFNASNIATPLADYSCNGGYGDVSVYQNLVFRSIDRPQTTDQCAGSKDTFQGLAGGNHSINLPVTTVAPGFEGIRIIDITNPASPTFVKGVATDCGSFSNTLVPDTAHNRVLLYISSFPNVGLDTSATTPSAFGNTCKRNGATDRLGHSKITIVEVPLGAPATAHVLKTVTLPMSEPDPFFRDVQKIPGYTGDFSNVPGYRGCHDITVFLPKKEAAAACISDAFLLNIADPANPTVKSHFTNPYIDLCARGILRTTTSSPGPPNCMWNAAQFTMDGKYVMFSDLASGRANCTGNGTALGTATCNSDGNTQVGADRYYDGTATTNECEVGSGTGLVRSPWYRGAIWVYDVNDPSFPLTSFKEPRWERYTNQGCSSHLLNILPVPGQYLTAASWQLAGVDVVNWTNLLNPTEEGYFDVNTTAAESTANAYGANRPAGNSAARANAWASYWYNGKVYVSYDSPQYGDWAPLGSRGLESFSLGGTAAAHALTLGHLNPQTQEDLLKCTVGIAGKFRVGKSASHKITVKGLRQALAGIKVQLKGYGIVKSGTTGAKGGVTFKVKPKKATKMVASVANAPNLVGCKATKSVAKKKKARTAHKVAFKPTALSRRVI